MGEDKSALSTEVHIICGPPGSGKTTFVQKHMQPGDLILDMDAIVAALTGNKSTHPDYSNVMNTALAVRETITNLLNLARQENGLLSSLLLRTSNRSRIYPGGFTDLCTIWIRQKQSASNEFAMTLPDQIKKRTAHL